MVSDVDGGEGKGSTSSREMMAAPTGADMESTRTGGGEVEILVGDGWGWSALTKWRRIKGAVMAMKGVARRVNPEDSRMTGRREVAEE